MPLFTGPNWDYGTLRRVYDAIEKIAFDEASGSTTYPVQIEVITSEQMLDAYCLGRPAADVSATGASASASPITRRCTARASPVWPTRS
jgi:hypothetical protein